MELIRYRNLIKHIVLRDIRLKYCYSSLGMLWSLLNPVLLISVYTFAFSYVLESKVPNYALFLLAGMLPWTFFASSALASASSILDNAGLIKKLRFPLEIVPVSIVFFQLFLFVMALAALLPAAYFWFGIKPSAGMAGFAVMLVLEVIFTAGVSLFLSTATVYFRDVRHLTEVFLMMLFWLTPVVYDFKIVPPSLAGPLFYLNPMTAFTIGYQETLLRQAWPSARVLGVASAYAAGAFLLGRTVFAKFKNRFAEII